MTLNKLFFLLFTFVSLLIVFANANTPPKKDIIVYHSKYCGCCKKWMEHIKGGNFNVTSVELEDVTSMKLKLGVPARLNSCHTAVVDGYLLEGHIPMVAIEKLLRSNNKSIKGLAVPGMPIGSPGMEGPYKENYHVYSFSFASTDKIYMSF